MSQVGKGEVAILPILKGFRKTVKAEVETTEKESSASLKRGFQKAGDESGTLAGRGFKARFSAEAKNTTAGATREMVADVAKAAREVSASRLREQDAAGKVRVAEAQLADARKRYSADSVQVVRAEERLASATRTLGSAQDQTRAASGRLADAQKRVADASEDAAGRTSRGWAAVGGVITGLAERAGAAGRAIADRIGAGVQAASRAAAVGLLALTTQAVAITKSAVAEYATWEQAAGGIDTLFKDASATVQRFAARAFQTAGVSANKYMQQVTSFSASLISSLDGDTVKAARLADQAMIDMSDNANKMGTDIASIQNTYQGFAKQNYTMLDNLKLGYGGTKTEMERLLADAAKLSGIKYDIGSFADIVAAIHVVQTELGITGTTALEAAETIEGSVGAMRAAWENWLAELGKDDGDVEGMTSRLTESVGTVLGNLIPRVKQILRGLVESIPELLSGVVELLPRPFQEGIARISVAVGGLTEFLKPLTAAFVAVGAMGILPLLSSLPVVGGLFSGLASKLAFLSNPLLIVAAGLAAFVVAGGDVAQVGDLITGALTKMVDYIYEYLPSMVLTLVEAVAGIVTELVPQIVRALAAALPMLVDGLALMLIGVVEALDLIIPDVIAVVAELLPVIVETLMAMIPALLDAALLLFNVIVSAIPRLVPELIEALIGMLPVLIGTLLGMLPGVLGAAVELFLGIVTGLVTAIPELILALVDLLPMLIQTLVAMIPQLILTSIELFLALVLGLVKAIPDLLIALVGMLPQIAATLIGMIPDLLLASIQLFLALVDAIPEMIPELLAALGDMGPKLVDAVLAIGPKLLSAGQALIGKLIEGIKSMINKVGEAVGGVMDFIGGFFPHSPAKRGPFSGSGWTRISEGGQALSEEFLSGVESVRRAVQIPVPVMGTAGTGAAGGAAGASVLSLDGMRIEGTLDLGDGLKGLVRGVLRDETVSVSKFRSVRPF